jgi:hypothetical protein
MSSEPAATSVLAASHLVQPESTIPFVKCTSIVLMSAAHFRLFFFDKSVWHTRHIGLSFKK